MKTLRLLSLVITALFINIPLVHGQIPPVFRHLKVEDGLTNNEVTSFLKDSRGRLWIGTGNGLNIYDGNSIKKYTRDLTDPCMFQSNAIEQIIEDASGTIWIKSFGQYSIYNHAKDNFSTDVTSVLAQYGITLTDDNYQLHVDCDKNLWVINRQSIFCYDFTRSILKKHSIPSIPDNSGVLLRCGSDDSHLHFVWDKKIWRIGYDNVVSYPLPDALTNYPISGIPDIYIDKHGGTWLFQKGLQAVFYQKKGSETWTDLSSKITARNNAISDLCDDGKGRVWISTDHKGLFIYDYINDKVSNIAYDPVRQTSLLSNRLHTVYCDDIGTMWIGHYKKGVSYFHESFSEFISNHCHECGDVAAIMEDHSGNLWIGTDGNGLFVKEKSRNNAPRKINVPDLAFISLVEDDRGRIWAGTFQDGLFLIDGDKITQFTTYNSNIPYNKVWSMTRDRYGNIWIGCVQETLVCFNPYTLEFKRLSYSDGSNIQAMSLFCDSDDKLYVGTTYGLCVMDIVTHEGKHFNTNRSRTQHFQNYFISFVYKDSHDCLWLSHRQGITLFDLKNDTLHTISTQNGLCDNVVEGIVQDNHGTIWISTGNGLTVFKRNPNPRNAIDGFFYGISSKNGLTDNNFNSYSVCRLSSGDILFGNSDGYICINPNKSPDMKRQPVNVYLKGLSINHHPIHIDSLYNGRVVLTEALDNVRSLTFTHHDKLIDISLSSVNLLNANKIKYAYKIDGVNEGWHYTSDNKVVFASPLPGNYTLHIKACSTDGMWNESTRSIDFTILPPPYLSNIAILLYVLLLAGTVIAVAIWMRHRQRSKFRLQRQKLQQEQQALINEMKIKFFTNISHDLRTPLTLILSPVQMLLTEATENNTLSKLKVIEKNARQLLALINSLLDFRKLDVGAETVNNESGDIVSYVREVCGTFHEYAAERSISFSCMSEVESVQTAFDPVKMRKVINNLLSNAFKFTADNGEINVLIYRENDEVCVSVADNGIGISDNDKKHIFERFYQASHPSEKTGSGIGLHIAAEYMQLQNGSITVTDNYPEGSVFTIKVPITDTGEANVATTPQPIDEQQYTILLVDDNKDFCSFMSEFLSQEYAVLTVHNGSEALKLLKEHDINLVVSDIMMPVMNGIELCRQIKSNMQWSHIPVILLTARMSDEYHKEGLLHGADDYIVKPFDNNLLLMRIKKFIEWTEKSHNAFCKNIDVSPRDITITPLDEQFITKAIDIVEQHMSDPDFSVEKLGAELGLSRSYLYKKLMFITGKGPADFIRTLRLKRSKQLLEKSQKQIAEIAYEVGFNSPNRFTANFKSEFGLSPSDYIKSLK